MDLHQEGRDEREDAGTDRDREGNLSSDRRKVVVAVRDLLRYRRPRSNGREVTAAWRLVPVIENYSFAEPAVAAFVCIPLVLTALLIAGTGSAWRRSGAARPAATRAAVGVGAMAAAWLAITWRLAATGALQRWDRVPPPFGLLLVSIIALALLLALSAVGTRIARTIPLWVLVAVQGFRLPLELAMHATYERGIMPAQMSYSGRNFDIVTGATAIVVAILVKMGLGGRRLVTVWNVLGLALLVNVVSVAIASMPLLRLFGDDHVVTFVTYPPFVWLPAVMVLAALAGHLMIFRALRRL